MHNQVLKTLISSSIALAIISVFVNLLSLWPTAQIFAQSPSLTTNTIELSVSPPVDYFHLPPATTKKHVITLENKGSTNLTVSPKIVDFTTNGADNQVFPQETMSFPYLNIAELPDSITIPSGKKALLELTMTAPSDAVEREYPLTILFLSKENNLYSKSGVTSQFNAGLASNLIVLVSKQNTLKKSLEITQIHKKTFIDSFSAITFEPLVENVSIAASTASGSAEILNWKKEVVATFPIYPDTILGNNSRIIRAANGSEPDPEPRSFSFKKLFLFGPYQIRVTLLDQDLPIATKTTIVYALPLSLLIILALSCPLLILLYKKYILATR